MYKGISDYGIIGNFHTVALVGRDGSIDWLCMPHTDSPSIFAAILDERKGGSFVVAPSGEYDSTAAYVPETNILVTRFRTRTGMMKLTDFMPVNRRIEKGERPNRHELYRVAEVAEGELEVKLSCSPRLDYGRASTTLDGRDTVFSARNGDSGFTLCCSRPGLQVVGRDSVAGSWKLHKGDTLQLHLHYGADGPQRFDPSQAATSLDETAHYWARWLEARQMPVELDLGPFRGMLNRSSLLLKLLEFTPTGAIAAAATTSLPEWIGSVRNWDYRFSWIRDSSLTVEALYTLGHREEMENYFRWFKSALRSDGGKLNVLYGLRGRGELDEVEFPHLEGYKGSRPVRIGNLAVEQLQLDTYGEIMDAATRLSFYVGRLSEEIWESLHGICETVMARWRDKDSGIWEMRTGPFHFVFSKVMCWVALARGASIARRHGFSGDVERWEREMEAIRSEIFRKGWNGKKRAFVQHYDTDALDASLLLLPLYGFLPFNDPRMVSTVEAIRRELETDGFVYRYLADDGFPKGEGAFLVCTFWLVENLIGQGKLYEAEVLLLRTEQCANHLGIFSEEYDPEWREPLGNIPQAFTHIGYINSVISLLAAKSALKPSP